jgi:hypothetical protein
MPKYKLADGRIIDTTNYNAGKLAFFNNKYPDAVLVEDFQTDPASAETNVGSQKNTVSNSDNSLSDFNDRASGRKATNSWDSDSNEVKNYNYYKKNPREQRPTESFEDYRIRVKETLPDLGGLDRVDGKFVYKPGVLNDPNMTLYQKADAMRGYTITESGMQQSIASNYKVKDGKLTNDVDNEYGINDVQRASKILVDEDLDIAYENLYYNQSEDNTFVNNYFNSIDLTSLGINPTDFQGWLNKNGFSEDFEQDMLDGVYDFDGNNEGGTYYTDSDKRDLAVNKERKLDSMLTAYMGRQDERFNRKTVLEDILKGKEGVTIDNLSDIKYTTFDRDMYRNYSNTNFPELNKKNEENRLAKVAKSERRKNRQDNQDYIQEKLGPAGAVANWVWDAAEGTGNFAINIPGGLWGGISETAVWIEDMVGMDVSAKRKRGLAWEDEESDDGLNYFYVQGKGVDIDGQKYIRDADGGIYNVTSGYAANDILSAGQLIELNKKIDNQGVAMDDYNFIAGAKQMGDVTGNILFQVLGQKGIGAARGAVTTRIGMKINGYTNVAKYKKMMALKKVLDAKHATNLVPLKKNIFQAIRPELVDAAMFQSLYGASIGYENTIAAAKKAGLSDAESEKLANSAMQEMAVLYALTGPINPRIPLVKSMDKWINKSGAIDDLVEGYTRTGSVKAANVGFKQKLLNFKDRAANFGLAFGDAGFKEVVQENIQQKGEFEIVNARTNERAGFDLMKSKYTEQDFINTSILSFAAGGLLGGASNFKSGFKQNQYKRLQNLIHVGKDIKGAKARLNKMILEGKATAEQVDAILFDAEAAFTHVTKMPPWLMTRNPEAYIKAARISKEIEKLEDDKKNYVGSFTADLDERIKNKKAELDAVTEEAAAKLVADEANTIEKILDRKGTVIENGISQNGKPARRVETFKTTAELLAADPTADPESDAYFNPETGQIIINLERAAKTQAISAASHELLHKILKAEFSSNPEMLKIVGEFKAILAKTDSVYEGKSVLDLINDRLNALYTKEEIKAAPDEWLTAFSDLVAKKEVMFSDFKEDTWVNLGKKIVSLLKGKGFTQIKFTSGQDVFDFIRDYQENIQEGSISGTSKKRLAAGEDVKSSGTVNSRSVAKLNKTKQKFKDIEGDFKSGRSQNIIAGELFDMVETQISNRFNLRPQVRQDLRDDVIERLYAAQETTKWDGRGDLYGFINGRIAKRILDALRSDSSYLENIDNNQFDALEKAANVVAEIDVATKSTKPDYKSLLKSNVVSKETEAAINEKVLRTVRTLKSKIDADISSNRTVSPLIAEIKKDMGKQADIDLKKSIGGIKDGVLEGFLIKNKKAILENMTTTWLTGAIPGAIQKQVDGTFISNWKGQKIDRETVSTDNAGRTSGAEITRRKPGVSSMTDAEFLSYFINDNKLIRGRKESLAKAMAEEVSIEIFNSELQNENSDISKAFEQNQNLKGVVLAENFIQEVSRQSERGNVKFSKSLTKPQLKIFSKGANDLLNNIKEADVKLTNKVLTSLMVDTYGTTIPESALKSFAKEIVNHIKRYTFKSAFTDKVDFETFVFEGMALKESNSNLYKAFNLQREDLGSLSSLFSSDNVTTQRGLSLDFNNEVVAKEGADGVIKLVRWSRGHQSSSGKIGDGRNQIYAGNGDYINNNLNKIPGVEIVWNDKTNRINSIKYNDEVIENWNQKIKTPPQKAGNNTEKSKAAFEADYQIREDAAREAWGMLTDYLGHIKSNGNSLDWIMTMMSLKSNMASVLKAAAPVKYYFEGNHSGPLRYEHMIPTEYMVLKLTEYYWKGQKFDLNTLRDKYNVAVIPVSMDDNFNIQRQSQMNPNWDPMNDPEWKRYFDEGTYGYPNMYAIKSLGGETKGDIIGKDWISANKIIKPNASKKSKSFINTDKALNAARLPDYGINPKGISVWDFDDTLAKTKSSVLYTMPNGKKGKLNAEEFARTSETLLEQGAEFNFDEFSKVVKGSKGPFFEKAMARNKKFGNSNVYILTARPANSAEAIHTFLKGIGLEIPIENITGLANGDPQAKADWVVNKFNEGYNDFYFADDHIGNVKAVANVLKALDVKSKVQLAKTKFSKSMDPEFNKMMERSKGVESIKEFSDVVAKRKGANIGRWKFLVSSAEDFRGLTSYTFAGKGKQGEADQQFFEDALLTPYFQGVNAIETERQTVKNDFKALSKKFKTTVKKLGKLTPEGDFTYDQAVRVFLWTRAGIEVPGISKRDQAKLNKLVSEDSDLTAFADAALLSSKKDTWIEPTEYWDTKTLLSDLNDLTEKINRKEYLAEFIANVDIIFSPKNLNKVQALYGTRHRDALEDAIYSMKNGTNRPSGGNKISNKWNNWVNNSIGTIMFFNRRSAVMQLLSTVNFINWSDNNPLKAGLAFANQIQYWKDFAMIFNSDKLKQRRGGLKSDVQEAEIANAAKGAKNKAAAVISYMLKIGFTPTQIADSFAISMGGASMYRNRINTYKKQGLDQKAAEEKAWLDFTKLSDETQQSGDPALVSQQQRSTAGRLILSFQNTTMQYTRLMKKASQDLINGRGDAKTNISKIIYYGAVQNFIFNALSNTLFALLPGFDDEDDKTDEQKQEIEDKKSARILNGMMDSLLRGTGIYGSVISTVKNTIRTYYAQEEKGYTANHAYTLIEAANLAPAIGSKLRKINSAIQTNKFEKDVIEKRGWDVTINGKFNLSPRYNIVGSLVSGTLNVPLDRAISEVQGISEALDSRNSAWQRVALGIGWRAWDVGAKNEEHDLIKTVAKIRKKAFGKIKAKETRRRNKVEITKLESMLSGVMYLKYKKETKGMSISKRIEYLKK